MKKQSQNMYTERLTLRISKKLYEKAKRKAQKEEMSVSAYVRELIKENCK